MRARKHASGAGRGSARPGRPSLHPLAAGEEVVQLAQRHLEPLLDAGVRLPAERLHRRLVAEPLEAVREGAEDRLDGLLLFFAPLACHAGILDEGARRREDPRVSVDVLLVRTHSPGNLGSAARACNAFGARLLLLDPRADAEHEDARAFSSGAGELLDGAPRLSSFEEAEEGAAAHLTLTSLRGRSARGLPPAWSWAAARRAARGGRLLLSFGPERSGLTTEEMRRATGRLSLPTLPAFPVLNLAQAVAAALALLHAAPAPAPRGERADAAALRRLSDELSRALLASGYLDRPDEAVLGELLAPLRRARPTPREAELWAGALRRLAPRSRAR